MYLYRPKRPYPHGNSYIGLAPFFLRKLILGAKVVYLIDFKQEIYCTLAWPSENENELISFVYSDSLIGEMRLHLDGSVTDVRMRICYIDNWLPEDDEEMALMLLSGAKPFNIKYRPWKRFKNFLKKY